MAYRLAAGEDPVQGLYRCAREELDSAVEPKATFAAVRRRLRTTSGVGPRSPWNRSRRSPTSPARAAP